MVGDHTSYWQNRSEFVPLVLREISTTLGLGLFGEKDHAALDDVARRHHQNVVWLKVSRWATLLSVGLMFWLYGDVLLTRGRELAPLLTGAGTPLESLATRVKDVVMFVLRLVFRDKSGTIGLQLLGAAVPMALVALWLYAYRFLWRWWDGIALEAVFKPGSIGRKDQSVLAGIIIAVGVTPLAIVLAWPLIARIQVSHLIAGAWIAAFTILILVSVFGLTRTGWDSVRKSLKGDLDAWKDLKEKLKLIGVMVGTLAFFLLSAIPALEPFRGSAAALLGIAGSIYFLVRIQIGYIKRARERYQDAIAWTVIAAPPVIALSGTAILTAVLGPQNEAGMPPYSGFLISFFVLYFVTIGVANWLVGRSARSKNAV